MIESMTGYGSGNARHAGNTVDITLRSVNNKTLKIAMRLPEFLIKTQQDIEELIKNNISRGTVFCQVEFNGPLSSGAALDEDTVQEYCRKLRSLAKKTGLPTDIRIEQVAALPGAFKENRAATGELRTLLLKAASKALGALKDSRRREGAKIESELRKLLARTISLCDKVDSNRVKFLQEHKKRIAGRIRELLADANVKVNPSDIAKEAAISAERSDIAEEIQRLGMHTGQMAKVLSSRKPAGRRLEFISQEMLREANTMSAKSISNKLVVPLLELKSNIDRIREQAQNVQ